MSKHTPEPWSVDKYFLGDILDAEGHDVMTAYTPKGTGCREAEEGHANVARVVAAVNAVKSIPTSALRAGVVEEMTVALRDFVARVERGQFKLEEVYEPIKDILTKLKEAK